MTSFANWESAIEPPDPGALVVDFAAARGIPLTDAQAQALLDLADGVPFDAAVMLELMAAAYRRRGGAPA